jgi:hypothetical protein
LAGGEDAGLEAAAGVEPFADAGHHAPDGADRDAEAARGGLVAVAGGEDAQQLAFVRQQPGGLAATRRASDASSTGRNLLSPEAVTVTC